MELYTKNTKLKLTLKGDGSELFDYNLPYPDTYERQNSDVYRISYALKGTFNTNSSLRYLNDIIARFTLSMQVLSIDKSLVTSADGLDLKLFQGLKSISKAKDYEKVDNGQDNVFWSIKLYTESLIKANEGLIAYYLIESYALDTFVDRCKDKSTLRAKCRSIWNWYDEREWVIPTRKGLGMSRTEGAKIAHTKLAEDTKRKVLNVITGIYQNDYLKKNGSWNVSKIAKDSGTSRNTVMKYIKEYDQK